MRREIRKSIKWRPGPQKNNQRGPKNNQKWSKTIPKSTKMARRWAGGGRLAETPFLRFLGLFLTIFDCFLVLFGCFFGAQASILWIFLFRAPFFDCFWWFLIVFWLFFVIFMGFFGPPILLILVHFKSKQLISSFTVLGGPGESWIYLKFHWFSMNFNDS